MTKASDRIARAKRKYKVAEDATDSLLQMLLNSHYSFAIIVVAVLCLVGAVWWAVK